MTRGLYLEDLAVGQLFRAGPLKVHIEEMIRFARDNDPQYFHVDPEAAKASIFGGLIASGWQTAALSMRLLIESGAPFAKGVVGLGGQLSWPQPVRPGDSLSVESKIMKIALSRARPDRGVVTVRSKTLNQKNELVQLLTAKLIVFARGGTDDLLSS